MPTIREVAALAGVSPTTVSHVVNNTRFVSAEVRQRVLSAMDELGYRPNALARSLRRGETQTLGLILPDSANPFFAEIGRSIEDAAFELGYNVILCNTEGDLHKENLYVDVLMKKQVDGVIFVVAGDRSDSLVSMIKHGVSVVVVDRDVAGVSLDTVMTDNYQGGYLATQHLLSLGHTCIGCISGPSHLTPSAQRVTGYRQALLDAGLTVAESLILRGDFRPESGRSAAKVLLNHTPRPTAIFACNDMMAIGVLRAARELSLNVPNDVAVVGYDDIELASYTAPPLTTIRQPKAEIGRAAVQLLLERLNQRELAPRRELYPATLVIRGTCGGKA